jgi:hypothetical protein
MPYYKDIAMVRKLVFFCLLFSGGAVIIPSTVLAATYSITEIQSLEFGGWEIPSSGVSTVTVNTLGNVTTTGNPVAITAGSITPARYGQFLIRRVSGGGGGIRIFVFSNDTSRLNNLILEYHDSIISNGEGNLSNPGSSGKTLIVGGTLNFNSTQPDGVYPTTPNYVITVIDDNE